MSSLWWWKSETTKREASEVMLQNVPQSKIQGKVCSPEGWTLAEAMVGAVDREDAKP